MAKLNGTRLLESQMLDSVPAPGLSMVPIRTSACSGRTMQVLLPVVLALGCGFLPAVTAKAADPAVLAKSGSGEIVACANCHGAAGEGMASFPRLSGMSAAYLYRQMESIANGTRENAVMEPIVAALGDKGIRDMADYYASLPAPVVAAEIPGPNSPGGQLALRGDWDRGIPGCVQCHGPRGTGVGDHFPALAGQPAGYIVSQLKAWKDGTRKNDPLELMRHLSAKLGDAEMQDVAAWFAGQSPGSSAAREPQP